MIKTMCTICYSIYCLDGGSVVICVVMYVTLLPAVAGNLSGPDTCVSYPAREDLLLLTSPPTRPGTLVPARLDGGATG